MEVALTIAGSDSGGGAGIQADLKTFAARGVFGASVITAVTAQNTREVAAIFELPPEIIAQQCDAVCSDFAVHSVKTGMLGSSAIIAAVADKIARWQLPNLVVDPVMVAKSGDVLLREDAVQALVERILPLAHIITPNLPEAEVLFGSRILDARSRDRAAQHIWELAWEARGGHDQPFYVLIKGGHRVEGGQARDAETAADVLFDGAGYREYSAPRLESQNTHGTGCTFSAAICAELAKGQSTADAVATAKNYITAAIARAPQLGHGHGPLQHFPTMDSQ
jgi:hydroxymethylpyrimidine/phosphomethylpyrimidine kinase